jgi:hypothetical protein
MLSVVYQDSEYGPLPVVLAVFLMRSDAEAFTKKYSWVKVVDVDNWDVWVNIRDTLVKEVGHA